MAWVLGIDVGGTFTDVFAVDGETGRQEVSKVPSTPDQPAKAMIDGVRNLCAAIAIAPSQITRLNHGTTVATNTLIQGSGARVALITTAGFRDVLEIGRQVRPHMFDLMTDPPPPLVPRELRFEVRERILADGTVRTPLDDQAIEKVVQRVIEARVDACAVCMLFSFKNPVHERRIRDALQRAAPTLAVSISSDVHPEFREFERFSTTIINAFIQPVVATYLAALVDGFGKLAPGISISISQSSGGLMSVARATRLPVRTALSGPAAGVVGAIEAVRNSCDGNIITLDMGGTSADVSLIRDSQPAVTYSREIEGYPVRLSSLDINAVGAGGGSLAWIDRDGLLKVGPQSAGAVPGPACYGRGGNRPTVSDANLILGRLSPEGLIGGALPLDQEAARRALAEPARQLGLTIEQTALGIIRIVNSNMVRAIRQVSVERGIDPRDFTLVAFGGAGPLHAVDVARSLGMRRVIVPELPGLLCAQGLIGADQRESFVASIIIGFEDPAVPVLLSQFAVLLDAANCWFATEGIAEAERVIMASIDLRYVGQNFELAVPLPDKPTHQINLSELRKTFLSEHERQYGHSDPEAPIEVVNLRLDAVGRRPRYKPAPRRTCEKARHPRGRFVLFDDGQSIATQVLWRGELAIDEIVAGPAIIEQLDATTLIKATCRAVLDRHSNLIIELGA